MILFFLDKWFKITEFFHLRRIKKDLLHELQVASEIRPSGEILNAAVERSRASLAKTIESVGDGYRAKIDEVISRCTDESALEELAQKFEALGKNMDQKIRLAEDEKDPVLVKMLTDFKNQFGVYATRLRHRANSIRQYHRGNTSVFLFTKLLIGVD